MRFFLFGTPTEGNLWWIGFTNSFSRYLDQAHAHRPLLITFELKRMHFCIFLLILNDFEFTISGQLSTRQKLLRWQLLVQKRSRISVLIISVSTPLRSFCHASCPAKICHGFSTVTKPPEVLCQVQARWVPCSDARKLESTRGLKDGMVWACMHDAETPFLQEMQRESFLNFRCRHISHHWTFWSQTYRPSKVVRSSIIYVCWHMLMFFDVFCIYFSNVSWIYLCIWRFLQVPAPQLPEPELPHAVRAAEAHVFERVVFANPWSEWWPYEHLW